MLKSLKFFPLCNTQFGLICLLAFLLSSAGTMAQNSSTSAGGFGLGRLALDEEIAAWNTDIRPDGQGLPVGSGDVLAGEEIYFQSCAACHGDFGEAVGRWPPLSGGEGSLDGEDPVKSIGSYWPYLSTVFDYVRRAMPYGDARLMSDNEIYAVTSYILYLNDLVDEEFVLSNKNFAEIKLPNQDNFFPDDRESGEILQFSGEPCMFNCKGDVEITSRSGVLDVTPGASK